MIPNKPLVYFHEQILNIINIVIQTQTIKKNLSCLVVLIKYMGIKNSHGKRPHKRKSHLNENVSPNRQWGGGKSLNSHKAWWLVQ